LFFGSFEALPSSPIRMPTLALVPARLFSEAMPAAMEMMAPGPDAIPARPAAIVPTVVRKPPRLKL
jgi:hypothetical protein